METSMQHSQAAVPNAARAFSTAGERTGHSRTVNVDIPPGTDLNNPVPVPFQERNGDGSENSRRFPDAVYDNLPEPHRSLCQRVDPGERDVLLMGLLGVSSGIMPNVCGHYGGKRLEANLFAYVLGPYGEGKSGLMLARKIAAAIHGEKLEKSKELAKEYKHELARYKAEAKRFEQGKTDTILEEPAPAPHLKHFIPANIAKTGMLQLIEENSGRGTIFETEADTLADALRQEHGGFSDTLRQAFGHEPLSFFRRTNNEDVEIASPALSVVLSSTCDQLVRLIPSAENGLFSRFIYYELEPTAEFHNVFDKSKNGYGRYFAEMGTRYKELHDRLASLSEPIHFELQPHQELKFVQYFSEQKSEVWEYVSASLGGTINRLGMICFRIAMQLSVLRAFEKGYLPLELTCTDRDFENALRMARTLMRHTMSVYGRLPRVKSQACEPGEDKDTLKLEQKRRCFGLYNGGMTNYRQIAVAVFGSETHTSKVYRWIKS